MIRVSSFGKVEANWRDELIQRTKRLIPFEWNEINIRKMPDQRTAQMLPEEKDFLASAKDFWLLDANGKSLDSDQWYQWIFQPVDRHLVVGPAIGFHEAFYSAAKGKISLSPLTFTHKLAQTILAESIYRAACQLKNHPFVK